MSSQEITVRARCSSHAPIHQRDLLDRAEATGLEAVFKILGNATRLRLLHSLVLEPGLALGALARRVGMRPQAVSNQLRRLVDRGIVAGQRDGNYVHYRIVDPCTVRLLEEGLCVLECGAVAGDRIELDQA